MLLLLFMVSEKAWQKVLDDGLIRSARDVVFEVADTVGAMPSFVGTASRLADLALLSGYLALYDCKRYPWSAVVRHLNRCVDLIVEGEWHDMSLFGGLSGLGWTMSHLNSMLLEFGTTYSSHEDPVEEIDKEILRRLQQQPCDIPFDLIRGLVGTGVYLLWRLPRRSAFEGLRIVLDQLEQRSEEACDGITWRTGTQDMPYRHRNIYTAGYFNLGVAHGIPAVIYLLSEMISDSIEAVRSVRLLDGAVRWLLSQQHPPGALSRFSFWVAEGEEPRDSRLAWCYGDLGIASVLHRAGQRVGRDDWRRFALSLFDSSIRRTPDQDHGVTYPSLCHGSIGVAHIYNRVYQAEGGDGYRRAANRWYEHGLRLLRAGSSTIEREPPVSGLEPESTRSILSCSIGVALALISALTEIEPRWDGLMLLSRSQPPTTRGSSAVLQHAV